MQDPALSAMATAHHAFTSAERYELKNDAQNHDGSDESGVAYQAKLKQALDAVWAGRFSVAHRLGVGQANPPRCRGCPALDAPVS